VLHAYNDPQIAFAVLVEAYVHISVLFFCENAKHLTVLFELIISLSKDANYIAIKRTDIYSSTKWIVNLLNISEFVHFVCGLSPP